MIPRPQLVLFCWVKIETACGFFSSLIGDLLVGTSKGLIFETEIVLEGDKFFSSSLEQYWKQV